MPPPPTIPSENGESVSGETTLEGETTTTSIIFPDDESTSEGEEGTTAKNNRPSETFCLKKI